MGPNAVKIIDHLSVLLLSHFGILK